MSSEGAVASFSVVEREPWGKGVGAFLVAVERLPVGPFLLEGAVESFDLAVLPWAVGLDELVLDAVFLKELGELAAASVRPCVVGHQSFDADDAVRGEVLDGSLKELSAQVSARSLSRISE